MKSEIAYLTFDVFIDCPECGASIDLCEGDDGTITTPIFNNDWRKLDGHAVYCECGCEFEIKELQH